MKLKDSAWVGMLGVDKTACQSHRFVRAQQAPLKFDEILLSTLIVHPICYCAWVLVFLVIPRYL